MSLLTAVLLPSGEESQGGSVTHCNPAGTSHPGLAQRKICDNESQAAALNGLHREQGLFRDCGVRTASLGRISSISRSLEISPINSSS